MYSTLERALGLVGVRGPALQPVWRLAVRGGLETPQWPRRPGRGDPHYSEFGGADARGWGGMRWANLLMRKG